VTAAAGGAQDNGEYPRFMNHQRFAEIVKFFSSPPPVTVESFKDILVNHQEYRGYVNRYSQEMTDVEQAAKNGIRQGRGTSLIDLTRLSFRQGIYLKEVTEVLVWEFQVGPDRDIYPRSMLFVLWPEIRFLYNVSEGSGKTEADKNQQVKFLLSGARMMASSLIWYADLEARSWERNPKRTDFLVSPVSEQIFFVRHAGQITEEDVSMWLSLYRSSLVNVESENTISQGDEQKYQKIKEKALAASAVFHLDSSKIVDGATSAEISGYYDAVCFQELRRQVLEGELAAKLLAAGAPVHKD